MFLSDFDYELPPSLIAQAPSSERTASRLMVLERQTDLPPRHLTFEAICEWLREGDLLVLNNTKVIPARLVAKKPTGGRVEILFLSQTHIQTIDNKEKNNDGVSLLQDGYSLLQSSEPVKEEEDEYWEVLARSSRPLREGTVLELPEEQQVQVVAKMERGHSLLRLGRSLSSREGGFLSFLEKHGEMPLPPYIDPNAASSSHKERYQTVFASVPGAVAAPTAGLHFTPELLARLEQKNVQTAMVTLHVGLGTFLPVRVDDIRQHQMHEERYEIPAETASKWRETRARGGRVVAVGTTSLRALESAVQDDGTLQTGAHSTSIFIYPGYEFRAIDGLITNFHLPCSTLLMLVSAFHGRERILRAYEEAVAQQYRFFSYGDAMLII